MGHTIAKLPRLPTQTWMKCETSRIGISHKPHLSSSLPETSLYSEISICNTHFQDSKESLINCRKQAHSSTMTNKQRTVRFSDNVEVMPNDDKISNDDQLDENEYTASPNRSAWSPSEASFFSQHRLPLQKCDLAPRQPKRSLDSILDDAINTCESLLAMPPCKAERKSKFFPATQIPTRHGRLDRSLFSMRTDSSLPPPPPLSNTDCIVTRALKEILQNRE